MKNKRVVYIALLCALTGLPTQTMAEKMLTMKIGPVWPRDVFMNSPHGKKHAWDAAVEFGGVVDDRIGFGGAVDFMWHSVVNDSSYVLDSVSYNDVNMEQKKFMFPVSMFLLFDPVPGLIVHPVIKGQCGFNMMANINKRYPENREEKLSDNGFYVGFIGKLSIDALYDLGGVFSVFTGFEYQWSKLRHKVRYTENTYIYKFMYGPSIRMGVRFLL